MKRYFVVKDIDSRPQSLEPGLRIIAFKNQLPIFKTPSGEGPFSSIEEITNKSLFYRELRKENPERARKIIQNEYILNADKPFAVKNSIIEKFDSSFADLLHHILLGEIAKSKLKGIHFFDKDLHEIVLITKGKNRLGVWEALVKSKTIKKDNTTGKRSSFFPEEWSTLILLQNLSEAFENKVQVSANKFRGQTKGGMFIIFLMNKKRHLTVYPEY